MRENYLTKGIVLKVRPYQEDSAEVALFTESLGKIRAVAQAAKKPGATFAAATQPGVMGEYALIKGRHLWRIRGAYHLRPLDKNIDSSARTLYLQALGVFARLLPEEEVYWSEFHMLEELLGQITERGEQAQIEVLFSLLGVLGYADVSQKPADIKELTRTVNEGLRAAQL